MDSVGEGEGGTIWENGIETCEMSCMKRDASLGSMHDAGGLGLMHWDDTEGWYFIKVINYFKKNKIKKIKNIQATPAAQFQKSK